MLQWSAAAPSDAGSPPGLPGVPQGYSVGQPAIAQVGSSSSAHRQHGHLGRLSRRHPLRQPAINQNNNYLEVIATLTPSTGGVQAPTLASWDMQIDGVDNE